ncbi:hypothetical protein CCACVL1_28950 [Corchorus capsularis]|uniref:Uncharacterized protein n=1 Tax=Corchorus capsularis TaxID=210143 RepID=A0A1R3G4K7_COCAP|nr:hypothetical protein CCACVL1_28950 [Corchorus capsularis]
MEAEVMKTESCRLPLRLTSVDFKN